MVYSKLKDLIYKVLAEATFLIQVRASAQVQEQYEQSVEWLNEAGNKPREASCCRQV